jgi:hypothetical protein
MSAVPATILSIISLVAGHPTEVVCDVSGGVQPAAGEKLAAYTWPAVPIIYLAPEYCELTRTRHEWLALPVRLLLHEAYHQRGITDEAVAEACAEKRLPWAMRRLGYRGSRLRLALDLARRHAKLLPERYRGGACPP